jgi:cytidylate kinase
MEARSFPQKQIRKGDSMVRDSIFSLRDEARLAAWHRQAQARKDQGRGEGPCITISREFGCQAFPLAAELAHRLGESWSVIDRDILGEVAKASGFSIDQIEKSRDTPAVLKAIFAMFLDSSRAEETELSTHLRQAICKFAAAGNCIIVGGGGVVSAREMKNMFHLRLVAPLEFRIEKIMKTRDMDRAQATDFVDQHQKQRNNFVKRVAGSRLDDPLLYHMVLNNSLLKPEQMAAIVEKGLTQLGICG